MRFIIIIIFVINSVTSYSQFKAVNINKTILRYDSTLINEVPETFGNSSWVLLRLKTTGDTLAVIYSDGNVWTKANIVAGSIDQVGTTTLIQITLPSTVGNDRYFLNQQVIYHYTTTSHTMTNMFNSNPLKSFIRIIDGKEVAVFYGSGCIWNVYPSSVALLVQGIVKVVIP